jgi:hypothetical protein
MTNAEPTLVLVPAIRVSKYVKMDNENGDDQFEII